MNYKHGPSYSLTISPKKSKHPHTQLSMTCTTILKIIQDPNTISLVHSTDYIPPQC